MNPKQQIEAFDVMQRHQRARSLEHILDRGLDQGTMGPNYWVADGARLISRNKRATPVLAKRHQQQRASSVERMLDESSLGKIRLGLNEFL